ncbi:MAG: hypothetical protein H8D96_19920 [Desulfobacterales bacterium]|uniref:Uncharacterized protein n=1 Tax=Candidatus Desulfatibia vada TaxID=2841696 RepID=A0A8J6TWC0_9BACT|nr:hypothetical protein [Candidatus Desulfatibia vada]MBL6970495.1 hypothetical protein [Desulfobacterales bacterium]MBL7217048.1 hypothetical protein [Desulfobacteraceae bacterium]
MERLSITERKSSGYGYLLYISFMIAALLLGSVFPNYAIAQARIVVIPLYTEEGREARDGGSRTLHYRRAMGFIENQLVRHGFEVVNPFAKDSSEAEYNRVMERARENSVLASREMCKRYAVDVAYIVWLSVKVKRTSDGYCKARARLDGQGYDSAGRSLGANVSKTFKVTRRDCDDAVAEVEKEVGDLVGKKLTAWRGSKAKGSVVTVDSDISQKSDSTQTEGGVLKRRTDALENLINVRLDGATEYETAEVFGKVINTVTGVTEAKRYSSSLVPDNPKACFVNWRIRIEDTDPFRVQANVMKMIDDILDAGGEITLKGVPYRYTAAEIDLLKGIRPGSSTSRTIQFVVDRERARDRTFSGRHDPYKSRQKGEAN